MNRKLRITLSIGLLAFIAIVFVYTKLQSSQFEGPRISIKERSLDLGNGKPGEEMQGELVFENTGSKPLEYNIVTSCGCTSLTPRKGTLDIGESQTANVVLKLPEYAKSEKAVRIIVHSNDPDQPEVNCSARARCPAPFQLRPESINETFYELNELQEASFQIEVSPGESETAFADVELFQISSNNKFLHVNKPELRNGMYHFQIAVDDEMKYKENYGTIELSHKGDARKMVLPVSLKLVDRVLIVPSQVQLKKNEDGTFQDIVFTIINRQLDKELSVIELITPPDGISIKDQTSIGKNKKQIQVGVTDTFSNTSEIKLEFFCRGLNSQISCELINPSSASF
ncbi:Ig-like domain-containing protein [Gimesia aquarii]|uniref:HYDIN/VesB/CFA65-like Ig-like domain-containing protein n=1 Tax=Gimesia aquarii TaxID=2527964 RepID=A0A517W2P6_9PLAN|nr:DUF1573 domain-containing protein [Gimesia aquarii]QDT99534.1 hypothetical protein V144x_50450 [Gimesia aquarii]